MADLTEVWQAATRFRRALDRGGLEAASFQSFPRGACADTCELLGQYLLDSGLGEWAYRSGYSDGDRSSHGWIERDGMLVDITADQFEAIDEPVIVTQASEWHEGFTPIAGRRAAGISFYDHHDGGARDAMRADYAVLKASADALGERRDRQSTTGKRDG